MVSNAMTGKSATSLQQVIDAGIAADPWPLETLLTALRDLQVGGYDTALARALDRVLEAGIKRGDASAVMRVLEIAAMCSEDPVALRASCRRALGEVCKERLAVAMLECAGFDAANVHPAEALRRLRVLTSLADGTLCLDKTWGFGVVKRVDGFYKRVTVDFTRKRGHTLSFAYAGETLQLVGPDHLLARRHADAPALTALAQEQPEEIIRLALRSYGPLTVIQLQELIAAEVLQGVDWKGFWDRARKALKGDPLVDIPTKRTEPLTLRQAARAYDENWYAALLKERDVKTILERLVELTRADDLQQLTTAQRAVLLDRLAFAIRGAEDRKPDLAARLVMQADRMGLGGPGWDVGAAVRKLSEPASLPGCMMLPARELAAWLKLFNTHVPDAAARLGHVLGDLPLHAVHVVLDDLRELGLDLAVSDIIRGDFTQRTISGGVLDYVCQHTALLKDWTLGNACDLMFLVIPVLEPQVSGERYRVQKSLRERFEDRAWLESLLGTMNAREREQVLTRIGKSRGWDEAAKRSLLGRMIKLFPELQEALTRNERRPDETREARFTSWRTYRERQEQLRVLVEVTIPENSREIGVARSYGDLRENFEYQAAKDQQRLLMRRQSELERDLGDVKGSDFTGVPTDVVGMGTGVRVQRPDGATEFYWVLGEWDRDEALGIISNHSEMAKRLEGARVGTELAMPGESEGHTSRVLEIVPLNDAVREWMRGQA